MRGWLVRSRSFRSRSVLFFGTDELSASCLRTLHNSLTQGQTVSKLELVCPPDKPFGRGKLLRSVPTKVSALELGIPIHEAPPDTLKGWSPPPGFDAGVVVSFGYFLPRSLIDSFPYKCINLHPSKLPKYRGAAPLHHTLLNGDTQTSVCIITVHPKVMDAGDILARADLVTHTSNQLQVGGTDQIPQDLDTKDTYATLLEKVKAIGGELLLQTLTDLEGSLARAVPQVGEITFAPKVDKNMGIVSPQAMTATDIFNIWRALGENLGVHVKPSLAGGATAGDAELIRLSTLDISPEDGGGREPGSVVFDKVSKTLVLSCFGNTAVRILTLQPQGKKVMAAHQFNAGYISNNPSRFSFR